MTFISLRNTRCTVSTSMRNFSSWIQSLKVIDLPAGGSPFTWTNNQAQPIMSRLDGFLITLS